MGQKKKITIALIIACATLFVAIATLVIVLVATSATTNAKIKINYTGEGVNVRVSANAYIGNTLSYEFTADGAENGSTYIDLTPRNVSDTLLQPTDVDELDKDNNLIVYEYAFLNLTENIDAMLSLTSVPGDALEEIRQNVVVSYAYSDAKSATPTALTRSDSFVDQLLPAYTGEEAAKYIYVFVEIDDLLYDAKLEGNFAWQLRRAEDTEVVIYTLSTQEADLIERVSTGTTITNDVAESYIYKTAVGATATPDIIPAVTNKTFVGWTDTAGTQNVILSSYNIDTDTSAVTNSIRGTAATTLYPVYKDGSIPTTNYSYDSTAGTYTASAINITDNISEAVIPDVINDGTHGVAKVVATAEGTAKTGIFAANNYIKSAIVGNFVQTVGRQTFYNCYNLVQVALPNTLQRINNYAFSNTGLTELVLPSSVTSLLRYTFSGCSQLTTLVLSEGLENIYEYCFENCTALKYITIPSTVKSIAPNNTVNPFKGCTALECIVVDSNNKVYSSGNNGNYIMDSSKKLVTACKATVIPGDVKSIGVAAFYDMDNLVNVTIPSKVITIYKQAFYGCDNIQSVTFPVSLVTIGDSAFAECISLQSINIPKNVASIGSLAFNNCTAVSSIVVNSANSTYTSSNGSNVIMSSAGEIVTACTNSTVPNGAISISNGAFQNITTITSIMLPSTIQTIGDSAFDSCTSLTSVNIPEGVISIGAGAFRGCDITSIMLPSTIQTIGNSAFESCDKLSSVVIPASVTSLGESVFGQCALDYISVDSDNTYYNDGNGCNVLIETASNVLLSGSNNGTIPEGVVSIAANAFAHCRALTTITLPSTLTTIGDNAFYICTSLTGTITIPASVTSIGSSTFQAMHSLEGFNVEDGNTVYSSPDGSNAILSKNGKTLYYGCKNTVIPTTVTTIQSSAFHGCSSLTEITIPSSVTSIRDFAFYGTGLTSINIPSSVVSIYRQAFVSSKLTSVTFEDTANWWISSTSSAINGTAMDVSDTAQNAAYLKENGGTGNMYWFCKPQIYNM